MLAMAVPLYLFYELTILALSLVEKRRAKEPGRSRGGAAAMGDPRAWVSSAPMAIKGKKKSQSRGSQGVRSPAAAPRHGRGPRRKTSWWRTRDGHADRRHLPRSWRSASSCGS